LRNQRFLGVIPLSMRRETGHQLGMLPRRSLGRLLGSAVVSSVLPVGAQKPHATTTLFSLGRSKNANIVCYVTRSDARGLDPSRPIDAFWLMLAEDGRREELTWAERKLAYGFSVAGSSSDRCVLRLTACPERPLLVERQGPTFRAMLLIAGKRAALTRIFVQTTEGSLLPSVQYLDLFGRAADGAAVHERLAP